MSTQRRQERRQDHQGAPRRGRPDLTSGGRGGEEEGGRVSGDEGEANEAARGGRRAVDHVEKVNLIIRFSHRIILIAVTDEINLSVCPN